MIIGNCRNNGEANGLPIMLLIKKSEISTTIKASLTCETVLHPWYSLFYGDQNILDKFKADSFSNQDIEYQIFKKMGSNGSFFSEEERNCLFIYASIRRIMIMKKSKEISALSFFILENFPEINNLSEIWRELYGSPIFNAKNNGVIKEDFILTELLNSIKSEDTVPVVNYSLSSIVSYTDEMSGSSVVFVGRYKDYIDKLKIKYNKLLSMHLEDKQGSIRSFEKVSVDRLAKHFWYLSKDSFLLCATHLREDKLVNLVNGQIVLKQKFMQEYKHTKVRESKSFINEIKDLHKSVSESSHMLLRCDNKDVIKLYKKACYAKI